MATAAGGIATPKNIVDYIGSSTVLGIMASSTSTVAHKCITYGILSSSTVGAGQFQIAGTYTNTKCVKFSDISKKVTLGLTISPSSFSFTAGGGSKTATVKATDGYVSRAPFSTNKPSWINVSGTVGLASISASANTSSSSRSGTVYISAAVSNSTLGSSATGVVSVSQAGSTTKTLSRITISPTTTTYVAIAIGGISYITGSAVYTDGSTQPLTRQESGIICQSTNSSYISCWTTYGSGNNVNNQQIVAVNGQYPGTATITVQYQGKSASTKYSATPLTNNSVFKMPATNRDVRVDGLVTITLALSNTGSNARTYTLPTGINLNSQSGVCVNNFAPGQATYITSQNQYNQLYVNVTITGFCFSDGSTGKYANVSVKGYSGTNYGTQRVSYGGSYTSGFMPLSNLATWSQYNTLGTQYIGVGKVVPCSLYVSY